LPKEGEMITVADLPNINLNVKELDIDEFIDVTENKYSEIYNVFNYYKKNPVKSSFNTLMYGKPVYFSIRQPPTLPYRLQ
jgi:hypothetical protein